MAEIINGKFVSSEVRKNISADIKEFEKQSGIKPGLAVILVGNNPASAVYVRNKHKACLEVGINSYEITMPEETTEEELLAKMTRTEIITKANRIRNMMSMPDDKELIVTAVSVGDIVFAGFPVLLSAGFAASAVFLGLAVGADAAFVGVDVFARGRGFCLASSFSNSSLVKPKSLGCSIWRMGCLIAEIDGAVAGVAAAPAGFCSVLVAAAFAVALATGAAGLAA